MLSPLPAVSCGCDRAVAAQESWAACAASQALGICTLARWSSPSHPSTCHQSTLCSPATAGKCHLLLPWAVLQLSECVSLLKGKQTNNPVSESAFWSLHPFGGKNLFPIAAGAISSPQAWQKAVSGAGGAEDLWSLLAFADTAHQLGPTECDCFPQA